MGFTFNNREDLNVVDSDLLIESVPPPGYCKLQNLYVDPVTKKVTYDWDDTPEE